MTGGVDLDHLLRHNYGPLVGALTRRLGAARLDLAEDIAQEALLRAVKTWPYRGVPDNPGAWLLRVGRNLAVDAMRRARLEPRSVADPGAWSAAPGDGDGSRGDDEDREIADDALRVVFTCCHPALRPSSRVALTLKIGCGLGVSEIAAALLQKPATVAQRISRAKAQLQALPGGRDDLELRDAPRRLPEVHQVLYLLFNEGYHASAGDELVRRDLVAEAVRLGGMLVGHRIGDTPEGHALLALFLLQGARAAGRVDPVEGLLLLAEQDRATWSRSWLAAGFAHLERASTGDTLSRFHVEAGIAAVHAAAARYGETDWARLLGWYDVLVALDGSPIAAVNRAVAVAKACSVDDGLAALQVAARIHGSKPMHRAGSPRRCWPGTPVTGPAPNGRSGAPRRSTGPTPSVSSSPACAPGSKRATRPHRSDARRDRLRSRTPRAYRPHGSPLPRRRRRPARGPPWLSGPGSHRSLRRDRGHVRMGRSEPCPGRWSRGPSRALAREFALPDR